MYLSIYLSWLLACGWALHTIQGLSTDHNDFITPSELETLTMDRTGWRFTYKSAVEEFEVRHIQSWRRNRICANVIHHPPATSSARSATGCVVHILGFLPTTSPTHDDETCRIDGSVHDVLLSVPLSVCPSVFMSVCQCISVVNVDTFVSLSVCLCVPP